MLLFREMSWTQTEPPLALDAGQQVICLMTLAQPRRSRTKRMDIKNTGECVLIRSVRGGHDRMIH